MTKTAIILGGNGFIGHHLARKLKQQGYWVRTVDIEEYKYGEVDYADDYVIDDLRNIDTYKYLFSRDFDEVYQLAADMGGAGYVFTGENDANVMHNSALINLNVLEHLKNKFCKILYSSSACIYPEYNQMDPDNPKCNEDSAYPAAPDSEYGWEKIFSERLYAAYERNYGSDVRIARLHNVYGIEGAYNNGKEKVPAAFCRKVAQAKDGGEMEIWGDGLQTRSFTYIDDCLEGFERLMNSKYTQPINIGSSEMINMNDFARMIMGVAGKNLIIKNVESNALGVRGRCSDNKKILEILGWEPRTKLIDGIKKTYPWIKQRCDNTMTSGYAIATI